MEFTNGFDSWHETHFEFVQIITEIRNNSGQNKPQLFHNINETQGTGGFYELAKDWTNEFEELHKGKNWDGDFYDEIDSFIESKI